MKKYYSILKYEMKGIFRDKMTLMMLMYPFFILILSAFLIPRLLPSADSPAAAMYGSMIAFIMFMSMGAMIIAILLAFVLLDRKDEKTLFTIASTPLTVGGYLRFQATYHYIIALIVNLVVLIGTKLLASDAYTFETSGITVNLFGNMTYDKILVFSIVGALFVPGFGFILGALGKNKIEGFAYMKSSGILFLLPILLVLNAFRNEVQYALGLAPNFWAIKGLLVTVMPENQADMNFWLYMLVGAIYSIALNIAGYKFFIKRSLRV